MKCPRRGKLFNEVKDNKTEVLKLLRDYKDVHSMYRDYYRKNKYELDYVSDRLKNDKEVVLAAVIKDDFNIYFANPRLQGDKDIMRVVVNSSPEHICYASPTLLDDREFMLWAVKQGAGVLISASDRLLDDKELALIAVDRPDRTFKHLSKRLQDDKDVVLLAVKHNRANLAHVSERLQKDKDVLATHSKYLDMARVSDYKFDSWECRARSNSWYLLYDMPDYCRDHEDIVAEIAKHKPDQLKYASIRLQKIYGISK